jgi:hypothetical protein
MGYLLRLADANSLTRRDLVSFDIRFDVKSLQYHQLLPDPLQDPGLYKYLELLARERDNRGRKWNRLYARFCPNCLNEAPFWRAAWELIFYDACPLHGGWLIDLCSSCNRPLRWDRRYLLQCSCGAELRAEKISLAPLAVQRLSATIAAPLVGWQGHEELGIPLLQEMDIAEMQRLIRFFGGYLNPRAGAKPLKLLLVSQMWESWPTTSLAAEIMCNWPQAFHTALSGQQSAQEGENRSLREFLKFAYYYLYHNLNSQIYDPIRVAFEVWLVEHWQGGLARRNKLLSAEMLAKVQWIPSSVACNDLGVSRERLQGLIRDGLMESQTFVSDGNRNYLMVRRDQFEKIRNQLGGEMTLKAAMVALGIGKIRIRRLLPLLFHSAQRVNDSEVMPWCVPRSEVEDLVTVGMDLPRIEALNEHQISLAQVLRFWNLSVKDVVALIGAVKAGEIILLAQWEREHGIASWVFDIDHLRSWQLKTNDCPKDWVSIRKAGKALGIKEQVAYWLVRNGFLVTEKLATVKGAHIHWDELERFRKCHIFCKEIATKKGWSSKKVRQQLETRGIYPLQGEDADSCRQLIYAHSNELKQELDFLSS